jgi:hypothetical protein
MRPALPSRLVLLAAVAGGLVPGCGGRGADVQPVRPAVSFNRPRVPLGAAVEVRYTWEVGPGAKPIAPGHQAFVHVLDPRGRVLFTDDHEPVPPPEQWSPGRTYSYRRTVFVPVVPWVGEARVLMGLYDPRGGRRVALLGDDAGRRSYRVGAIELLPQTENIFLVFKEGWYGPEADLASPGYERTWTRQEAVVSFKNPRKDVLVYLEAETCLSCFAAPPTLTVSVGQAGATLPLGSPRTLRARMRARAEDLGPEEWVDLRLRMSEAFVPSRLVPPLNDDDRELGLDVYHLSVARVDDVGPLDGLEVTALRAR